MEKPQEQTQAQQPPTSGALDVYRKILLISVKDSSSMGTMAELVKDLKTRIKGVEEWFAPMKKAAKDAHQAICDREKEVLAPFKTGATEGQKQIDDFLRAESKRQQDENRRIAEENARQAAAEKKELEESAQTLEGFGQGVAAAALRQEAERVVAAPVFAPSTVQKTTRTETATVSATKKLVVNVQDKKAFLKYLVEKDSAAVFVDFKQKELEAWVRSNGFKAGDIPGLAIEETLKSSIR